MVWYGVAWYMNVNSSKGGRINHLVEYDDGDMFICTLAQRDVRKGKVKRLAIVE